MGCGELVLPCLLSPQQSAPILICLDFCSILDVVVALSCLCPVLESQKGQLQTGHIETASQSDGINLTIVILNLEDEGTLTCYFQPSCNASHTFSIVMLQVLEMVLNVGEGSSTEGVDANAKGVRINVSQVSR